MNEDKAVGITRAAEILGVSKSTIYRMVDNKILNPTKTPGGQRRFDQSELRDYLSNSKNIAAPQSPYQTKKSQKSKTQSTPELKKVSVVDPRNKLNELTGSSWLPLTKSYVYQKGLGAGHDHAAIERMHPAPFSFQDIAQLIEFFTKPEMTVLDPFGGVGSTAKAAALTNRKCISIELQEKWHVLAQKRLEYEVGTGASEEHQFINQDARKALKILENSSVDFVVTSPPYWSILNKKADHKVQKSRLEDKLSTNYSDEDPEDLSNIEDYYEFLNELVNNFVVPAGEALKPGKYFCLIVSDFRHKSKYISFHSDLIQSIDQLRLPDDTTLHLQGTKVLLQNHKSLLPYGYPFAYVENIHHQYILIFRKVK